MFKLEFQGSSVSMPGQKDPAKMSAEGIRGYLEEHALVILQAERRVGLGLENFGDAEFLEYIRLVRVRQQQLKTKSKR